MRMFNKYLTLRSFSRLPGHTSPRYGAGAEHHGASDASPVARRSQTQVLRSVVLTRSPILYTIFEKPIAHQ